MRWSLRWWVLVCDGRHRATHQDRLPEFSRVGSGRSMEQSVVAVGRRHKQRESVQASLVDVCAAMRATAGPTVSGELIEEGQARFCRERVDAVGAYGTEPVLGGLREKNSVQLLDRPWGAGFRIGHGLFVCWPHCDVVE